MSSTDLTEASAVRPHAPAGAPSSPGPALAAATLGFALITLDTSVVNVALPAVGADLGTGMTGLQWVADAYTLALAALLHSTPRPSRVWSGSPTPIG
ncbi:hypothetical protein ACWFR1_15160 [Streptomyces sp. NPDC055103]